MNTQGLLGRKVWMRAVASMVAVSMTLSLFGATLMAKPPGAESIEQKNKRESKDGPSGTDPASEAAAAAKAEALKGPKPVIKPDEESHDFGPVWVGPPLKHTFKIKNEGDAPLEITKVKPSCGCTAAGDHPNKLAPGEVGEFPFSMQSTKLRGQFEKGISITSNDPVTPELRLKLRGEVKRYVEVVPQAANFGKITSQEVQERVINITSNGETPLQLTLKPAADTGQYKFDLVEKTPGKQYDLHVTLSPPFAEGTMKTTLTLVTNIEAQKEIQIDATATVPPQMEIQPTEITLNPPKPDAPPATEATSRIIRVTNYNKTPVKILEATCDDPAVTVAVTERKPGEAYTLQVTMPAGYVPPAEGKTITVKTDDAKRPTHTIPIRSTPTPTPATARTQVKPAEALVGQPAPSFNLNTIDGKPVNNDTVTQNITVLDFFAPNCAFCKKQMPRLEPIREKFASQGVRFVAVSQKMGNKDYTQQEVVDLVNSLNFKAELVLDHGNVSGPMFKANSYPTMVVIGKSGKVEAVNGGNLADLETRLTSQLEALIAGKPAPTFATAKPPSAADAPAPGKPEDLIGKPAPTFSLNTIAGKPVGNADFAAAPATVLNFFAPNCGFCKKQIPRLETIRKNYTEKGIRFINVVETMGKEFPEEETLKILKDLGAELEVARDPGNKVGPMFNAKGFPTMVIIGKTGKVEAVNVGNIADLESKVPNQLDALIAGKSPSADARPAGTKSAKEFARVVRKNSETNVPEFVFADGQQPAGETPKPAPTPAPAQAPAPVAPATAKAPAPAAPPAPKPAPAISLTTLDGKPVSNAEFANAPATVLNFFAPNCGFCKKQIPQLEAIRKTYASKGVRFINVWETMGKEFTQDETMAILKEVGSELEVAKDSGNKFGPAFGANGFPTMVIVGKTGKIEATNVGALGDLPTRVAAQLDALIAGTPIPAQYVQAPPKPAAPAKESMVGKVGPPINLTTWDGKPLTNADFANAPATVLNFFAPNCGYCKKQIPRLETLRKTYADKGVRFVNVVETMGKEFTKEETQAILKEIGSELEVAPDPGNKVGPGYGTAGFPTMVIVGKSGKIEAVNVGNVGDLETRVQGQLDALIAGKPLPAVAAAPGGAPAEKPQRPAMQLVGQTAPAFALDTMEGKKISSDNFKDHPATVLNFVAPNCGFCKKQMPGVETVRAEYEAKGVRFVNVVQKMGKDFTDAEITDVFKGAGSRLEMAKDADNKVGQQFKAQSYPTMIVVDRGGKITHVNIGAQQDLDKSLKTQLDALIGGAGKGAPSGK